MIALLQRYRRPCVVVVFLLLLMAVSTVKSVYIAIFAFSTFLFSAVGTAMSVWALPRLGWWDLPNARSNHAQPVARGGGIAVVLSMLMFMAVSDAPGALMWGMLVLAGVSLLDDLRGVAPRKRLAVHAIVVAAFIIPAPFSVLPQIIAVPAEAWWVMALDKLWMGLALLWFINLYNFMDGIDGITGVETIGIGVGCAVLALLVKVPVDIPAYGLVAASAMAAFLLWNWHPAKIFLGDVGSIPLGFLFGVLLLWLASSGYIAAALILPAYYLADATLTLLRRALQGQNLWQAHSDHAYQQAVRAGRSHALVARDILMLNVLLIALAMVSTVHAVCAIVSLVVAYGLVWYQITFYRRLSPRPVAAVSTTEQL